MILCGITLFCSNFLESALQQVFALKIFCFVLLWISLMLKSTFCFHKTLASQIFSMNPTMFHQTAISFLFLQYFNCLLLLTLSVPAAEVAGIITGGVTVVVFAAVIGVLCWRFPACRSRSFWDKNIKRALRKVYGQCWHNLEKCLRRKNGMGAFM